MRITFIGLCIFLGFFQLRVAIQEQEEFSFSTRAMKGFSETRDPRLLTQRARQLYLLGGKVETAEEYLIKALAYNPLYIPAWLTVAEMRNDQGRKEESEAIFNYVNKLSRDIKRWRWDKAMLAYQLGRMDVLKKDLAYMIKEMDGDTKAKGIRFTFSLWPDTNTLVQEMGSKAIPHLFSYAIGNNLAKKAIELWPYIERKGIDTGNKELEIFVNTLIFNDEVEYAGKVWRKYFNKDTLLYNGSFQRSPMECCFGWFVGKAKGSSWRIERDLENGTHGKKLRIHFSGTHNVDYSHFFQIVPLASGKEYFLNGSLKTEGLTTDKKPFIEIVGFRCEMESYVYDILEEEQAWTPFSIDFYVPPGCSAIEVRVRRVPSDRFDNTIGGDLWMRDLSIEQGEVTFSLGMKHNDFD